MIQLDDVRQYQKSVTLFLEVDWPREDPLSTTHVPMDTI